MASAEALALHLQQEPEDLVMRAKVHDSLAECYLVTKARNGHTHLRELFKEYTVAEEHYKAAYDLLLQTVGAFACRS